MTEKDSTFIHITLNITLNEDDWAYKDPKIIDGIRFSIPLEMFNGENFKKMIVKKINALEKKYPVMVNEYEAEQERQRLEEEAEQRETPEKEDEV